MVIAGWNTSATLAVVAVFAAIIGYWLFCPVPSFPADPSDRVKGKRVLVTGVSQGIGRSLLDEFAKRGARHVVIAARSKDKLDQAAQITMQRYPGVIVTPIAADLSSELRCYELLQGALEAMDGKLDILVLNHITNPRFASWFREIVKNDDGISFLQDMFAVNTFSYIWLATSAMEHLIASGGSIGVVSSLTGYISSPKVAAYSATKHALHGFFNTIRMEFEMMNVRNVSITICGIGATDTEGSRGMQSKVPGVTFDPPSWAAESIVRGIAARKREIFHPHHLLFPLVVLHRFAPWLVDKMQLMVQQY